MQIQNVADVCAVGQLIRFPAYGLGRIVSIDGDAVWVRFHLFPESLPDTENNWARAGLRKFHPVDGRYSFEILEKKPQPYYSELSHRIGKRLLSFASTLLLVYALAGSPRISIEEFFARPTKRQGSTRPKQRLCNLSKVYGRLIFCRTCKAWETDYSEAWRRQLTQEERNRLEKNKFSTKISTADRVLVSPSSLAKSRREIPLSAPEPEQVRDAPKTFTNFGVLRSGTHVARPSCRPLPHWWDRRGAFLQTLEIAEAAGIAGRLHDFYVDGLTDVEMGESRGCTPEAMEQQRRRDRNRIDEFFERAA